MGIFSKKKSTTPTEEDLEHNQSITDSLFQEGSLYDEAYKATAAKGGKDGFSQMRDMLISSEKGGLGRSNSEKFINVDESLRSVVDYMAADKFTDDIGENLSKMNNMMQRYRNVLTDCDEYLKGTSYTQKGKQRKRIVMFIRETASRDLVGFDAIMTQVRVADPKDMAGMSWDELFKRVRTYNISVDMSKATKASGAIGDVVMFDDSISSITDPTGQKKQMGKRVFKRSTPLEMVFDDEAKNATANAAMRVAADMRMNGDELAYLRSLIRGGGEHIDPVTKKPPTNPRLLEASKRMDEMWESVKTQVGVAIGALGLKSGKIDYTARNVATKRIADLLGVGDLVVETDLATLHTGDGQKIDGFMMENSGGQDAWKLIGSAYSYLDPKNLQKYRDHKQHMFSTKAIRQMAQLQVFDFICGQIDRSLNNYHLITDADGKVTAIKAIDNDNSFGNNIGSSYYMKMIVKDGLLTQPIDKTFADAICMVSPAAIQQTLLGLIEKEQVDVFLKRLEIVQNGIKATESNGNIGCNGKKMIFDKEDDWGESMHERLFNEAKERDVYERVVEGCEYKKMQRSWYMSVQSRNIEDFGVNALAEYTKRFGNVDPKSLPDEDWNEFKGFCTQMKESIRIEAMGTTGIFGHLLIGSN